MQAMDIGEFGLIERLGHMVENARILPTAGRFSLKIGIGDDAASWHPGDGIEVCTTDTMVQGVHFTPDTTPWEDVGWKIMAANLSDIAAMGALPLYAITTIGMPAATPLAEIDALYSGLLEACHCYTVAIVGGDVVTSPTPFVTVALTGVCTGSLLTRSCASVGDTVAVVGYLGASAAGLEILQNGGSLPESYRSHLVKAHRRPIPRIDEGQTLRLNGIRCAMDISDSLANDLAKLCQASGVAARIATNTIPADPILRKSFPKDYTRFALYGGEDYVLLFAGRHDSVLQTIAKLGPSATTIGQIVPGKPGSVSMIDEAGLEIDIPGSGWEHFRSP